MKDKYRLSLPQVSFQQEATIWKDLLFPPKNNVSQREQLLHEIPSQSLT